MSRPPTLTALSTIDVIGRTSLRVRERGHKMGVVGEIVGVARIVIPKHIRDLLRMSGPLIKEEGQQVRRWANGEAQRLASGQPRRGYGTIARTRDLRWTNPAGPQVRSNRKRLPFNERERLDWGEPRRGYSEIGRTRELPGEGDPPPPQSLEDVILTAAYVYTKIFEDPLWAVLYHAFMGDWAWFKFAVHGGVVLPAGVEWISGPCSPWDRGEPLPYVGVPMRTACSTFGGTQPMVQATDEQINAAIDAGRQFLFATFTQYYNGLYYYKSYGVVQRIGADFDYWDSSAHGYKPGLLGSPVYDPVNDAVLNEELNKGLKRLGVDSVPDSLAELLDFLRRLLGPDWASYPGGITITKPINGPHAGPSPSGKPPVDVDTDPPTGEPDDPPVVHPPTRPPTTVDGTLGRINKYTRVNNGFREPPGPGTKERKGRVDKIIWGALNILGKTSEFADAVDAIYKALPKKIRGKAWYENGKHELSWRNKLRVLIENYDKIALDRAVAELIVSNVNDAISAAGSKAGDARLRKAFPNLRQRLIVRAAYRYAEKQLGGLENQPEDLAGWVTSPHNTRAPKVEDVLAQYGLWFDKNY